MDILLSLIGIGLTLPIIVAAIIAIRLESPGQHSVSHHSIYSSYHKN